MEQLSVVLPLPDAHPEARSLVLASVVATEPDSSGDVSLSALVDSSEATMLLTTQSMAESVPLEAWDAASVASDLASVVGTEDFADAFKETLGILGTDLEAMILIPPASITDHDDLIVERAPAASRKHWVPDEDGVLYEHINLNKDTTYWLVIAEAQFFQFAHFLKSCLTEFYREKFSGSGEVIKSVDFVFITPSLLPDYSIFDDDNIIVINPTVSQIQEFILEQGDEQEDPGLTIDADLALPRTAFASLVARNRRVLKIVNELVDLSGQSVGIIMFENLPEIMQLGEGLKDAQIPPFSPGISQDDSAVLVADSWTTPIPDHSSCHLQLLGPDPGAARLGNNKLLQYRELVTLGIPVVPHEVVTVAVPFGPNYDHSVFVAEMSVQIIPHVIRGIKKAQSRAVFLTAAYSSGGSQSTVVEGDVDDVLVGTVNRWAFALAKNFCPADESASHDTTIDVIMSEYLTHQSDPSVHAVVAPSNRSGQDEPEVYIIGIADMIIENRTTYRGMKMPTKLGLPTRTKLIEHTVAVGKWLSNRFGYRGIFGCDFLVTDDDSEFFVEVNARKQGSLADVSILLEHILPPDSPTPLALEFFACTFGRFPENALQAIIGEDTEPDETPQPIIPNGLHNVYRGLKLFYRMFKMSVDCPPPPSLILACAASGQPLKWTPAVTFGELGPDDDFSHKIATIMAEEDPKWRKSYSVERAMVHLVVKHVMPRAYVICGYPGPQVRLKHRDVVARVVAVGLSSDDADEMLEEGRAIARKLIKYIK